MKFHWTVLLKVCLKNVNIGIGNGFGVAKQQAITYAVVQVQVCHVVSHSLNELFAVYVGKGFFIASVKFSWLIQFEFCSNNEVNIGLGITLVHGDRRPTYDKQILLYDRLSYDHHELTHQYKKAHIIF